MSNKIEIPSFTSLVFPPTNPSRRTPSPLRAPSGNRARTRSRTGDKSFLQSSCTAEWSFWVGSTSRNHSRPCICPAGPGSCQNAGPRPSAAGKWTCSARTPSCESHREELWWRHTIELIPVTKILILFYNPPWICGIVNSRFLLIVLRYICTLQISFTCRMNPSTVYRWA